MKRYYSKDEICNMGYHLLCSVARGYHVSSPTSLKQGELLKVMLELVENGAEYDTEVAERKRGRPTRNSGLLLAMSLPTDFTLKSTNQSYASNMSGDVAKFALKDFNQTRTHTNMIASDTQAFLYNKDVQGVAVIASDGSANIFDKFDCKHLYTLDKALANKMQVIDGDLVTCRIGYTDKDSYDKKSMKAEVIRKEENQYCDLVQEKYSQNDIFYLDRTINLFEKINNVAPLARGQLSCLCCENLKIKKNIMNKIIDDSKCFNELCFIPILFNSKMSDYNFLSSSKKQQCFVTNGSSLENNLRTLHLVLYRAKRLAQSGKHVVIFLDLNKIYIEENDSNYAAMKSVVDELFSSSGKFTNASSITVIGITENEKLNLFNKDIFDHFAMIKISDENQILLDEKNSYSSIKCDL